MSLPRKLFLIILAISAVGGTITGLINVVSPQTASISLNGEEIEGWASLPVSIGVNMIFGVIIGLIAAGIASLFSRKRKADES